jgi:hypothetical protein
MKVCYVICPVTSIINTTIHVCKKQQSGLWQFSLNLLPHFSKKLMGDELVCMCIASFMMTTCFLDDDMFVKIAS